MTNKIFFFYKVNKIKVNYKIYYIDLHYCHRCRLRLLNKISEIENIKKEHNF